MPSALALIICTFVISFLLNYTDGQTFESGVQYCLLNTGGIGQCTSFHNCDLSLLAQEGENPAFCEVNNDDVFVCCPMKIPPLPLVLAVNVNTTTTASSTTTKNEANKIPVSRNSAMSKSSQKCLEYSKIKCENGLQSTKTIVNGDKVESVEHYPHMALLGYGDPEKPNNLTWQCGGTLISEQFILTAAHCLIGYDGTLPVVAHLGFLNKNNRTEFNTLQQFKITEIIKHPNRKDNTAYKDIALLKLNKPATFSKSVLPACLYQELEFATSRAQATGWGDLMADANTGSDDLMKVTLSILKHEDCSELYPQNRKLPQGIIKEEQFCAGENKKDTCQGDSGGPLQIIGKGYCMHSIIGITSLGTGCGIQPGIYTRVSNYVPWIESIIWS